MDFPYSMCSLGPCYILYVWGWESPCKEQSGLLGSLPWTRWKQGPAPIVQALEVIIYFMNTLAFFSLFYCLNNWFPKFSDHTPRTTKMFEHLPQGKLYFIYSLFNTHECACILSFQFQLVCVCWGLCILCPHIDQSGCLQKYTPMETVGMSHVSKVHTVGMMPLVNLLGKIKWLICNLQRRGFYY